MLKLLRSAALQGSIVSKNTEKVLFFGVLEVLHVSVPENGR